MTRLEAVAKLVPVCRRYNWGPDSADYFVDALEAIGLLEVTSVEDTTFKEAGERLANMFVKTTDPHYSNGQSRLTLDGAYEVLDILRKSGFKVVRE